jgi:hypothetical protein
MKKILFLLALLLSFDANANDSPSTFNYSPNGYQSFYSVLKGNIFTFGIGVSNPTYALDISTAQSSVIHAASSGANASYISIDDANGGQQAAINFQDAAASKFQMGKQYDNSFFLYDSTNSASAFVINTNGSVNIGENNQLQIAQAGYMVNSIGGYQTAGTKFTATGCSNSTTVGGASSGKFTSGTTGTCTVVITLNGATGATANNGWSCFVNNQTTANLMRQTASSTTTATISGTTVSGDVISFGCIAY